jgi:predicted neutral ceramidase superfamily lipid hydrolase
VIEWFYWVQLAIAIAAALLALGFAIAGRTPNDYTLGSTLLIALVLLIQVVMTVVAPAVGNTPTGSLLEFWMYLITALIMVIAGAIWALVERTVMSNVMLSLLAASIAVMVVRMNVIWFVNSA